MLGVLTRCKWNRVPVFRLNQGRDSRPYCYVTHAEAVELLSDRIAIIINGGTAIRLQCEEVQLRDQSCKMGARIILGFALEHRHSALVEGWHENHLGLAAC